MLLKLKTISSYCDSGVLGDEGVIYYKKKYKLLITDSFFIV